QAMISGAFLCNLVNFSIKSSCFKILPIKVRVCIFISGKADIQWGNNSFLIFFQLLNSAVSIISRIALVICKVAFLQQKVASFIFTSIKCIIIIQLTNQSLLRRNSQNVLIVFSVFPCQSMKAFITTNNLPLFGNHIAIFQFISIRYLFNNRTRFHLFGNQSDLLYL